MLSDEDIVRGAVTGHHAPSHNDEIGYASEMGENYAPVDEQQPTMGENDIGFNYYMYPTIHRLALSPARLKFIIGAAGSGKTSGIIWTLLLQAIMQVP